MLDNETLDLSPQNGFRAEGQKLRRGDTLVTDRTHIREASSLQLKTLDIRARVRGCMATSRAIQRELARRTEPGHCESNARQGRSSAEQV
jgi:hypothetical protein